MEKKKILTEGFDDTIAGLDGIISEILFCFDEIGDDKDNLNSEETPYLRNNTKLYYNLVGKYTAYLNRLLDVYHDNSREEQLKYKPQLLYFRKVHEFLAFLLRYPTILRVKSHDKLKETRFILDNKSSLINRIYKIKAVQENALFAGNFPNKLNNVLGKRVNKKINMIKNKKTSNLIE